MAKKGKLIVLINEKRHKEIITEYSESGWWVSKKGDRAALNNDVVYFVVLEVYINGLEQLNDFYNTEANFDAVFKQLDDLKEVLEVTKEFVGRPKLNEYPKGEKEE
ncbi:MAG: hypothetical protein BA863_04935 [Desulfovibrio sp. S3730MH75]|nr:MAG: hypothetical protein BA863_04935 [Desulfovibrio sp. S3730MH75]